MSVVTTSMGRSVMVDAIYNKWKSMNQATYTDPVLRDWKDLELDQWYMAVKNDIESINEQKRLADATQALADATRDNA